VFEVDLEFELAFPFELDFEFVFGAEFVLLTFPDIGPGLGHTQAPPLGIHGDSQDEDHSNGSASVVVTTASNFTVSTQPLLTN
jgi:hypothetical protein